MDRPGGVQSHVRDLSGWLRAQGHEVRIIAPSGSIEDQDTYAVGRCQTMHLHGTAFEISRATGQEVRTCVQDLRSWGAEVVHLHTPWTPMLAWQVWRHMKLPSVGTFHATLPEDTGLDPFKWYIRRAARHFHKHLDALIVPSEAPQAQWRALGVSPLPEIIPPAIDLSRWRNARTEKKEPFHVVYMGRLEKRKGVNILLSAWESINHRLPDATLTIAGAGDMEAELRNMAGAKSLQRLKFLPPPSDAEAARLVASANIFAAPATEGESFGLVLIEAMAAGALPVAADNAGFSTVLTGQGQDLLVPAGDANALADRIVNLAEKAETREMLGNWAREHAETFDVGTCGPRLLSIYQNICKNRK